MCLVVESLTGRSLSELLRCFFLNNLGETGTQLSICM